MGKAKRFRYDWSVSPHAKLRECYRVLIRTRISESRKRLGGLVVRVRKQPVEEGSRQFELQRTRGTGGAAHFGKLIAIVPNRRRRADVGVAEEYGRGTRYRGASDSTTGQGLKKLHCSTPYLPKPLKASSFFSTSAETLELSYVEGNSRHQHLALRVCSSQYSPSTLIW